MLSVGEMDIAQCTGTQWALQNIRKLRKPGRDSNIHNQGRFTSAIHDSRRECSDERKESASMRLGREFFIFEITYVNNPPIEAIH